MSSFKHVAMFGLLVLVAVLAVPVPLRSAEPPPDPDEQLLKEAKVATDDAGLLAFLKQRTGNDADLQRLDALVRQLGSDSFAEREQASARLVSLGLVALPSLRPARTDNDPEIARRAARCVDEIERNQSEALPLATVRLLVRRGTAGAAEALLRYVPYVAEEELEAEVWFGLEALVARDSKFDSVIAAALKDPLAARRAVAACILGRRGDAEQREAVRKLLADEIPLVRLRAAQGLLAGRDPRAIPVLLQLLREPSVAIGWQAEELLRWAAEQPPSAIWARGSAEERQACFEAWSDWWKQRQASFRWPSTDVRPGGPGLVLLWESQVDSSGKSTSGYCLRLRGCDGHPRYELRLREGLQNVAWLPEGRFLVFGSPRHTRKPHVLVQEWDLNGQPLRSFRTEFIPTKWRRLPNGYLEFTTDFLTKGAITCDPEGTVVRPTVGPGKLREFDRSREFQEPIRLPNGHTIFFESGKELPWSTRLVETDRKGTAIWELAPPPCGRPLLVYPLVRFGFAPAADGTATVDNLPRRLRALQSSDVLVRRYSLLKLQEMSLDDAAFRALLSVVREETDQYNQWEAFRLFARSGHHCRENLPMFLAMMLTNEEDARFQSCLTGVFRSAGPQAAVPPLLELFGLPNVPKNSLRRANAIKKLVLCFLGEDKRANQALHQAFTDDDPAVRKMALDALGWWVATERDKQQWAFKASVTSTVGLMSSPGGSGPFLGAAARILESTRPTYPRTRAFLPALIRAVEDPCAEVARLAMQELQCFGAEAEPAVPVLLRVARTTKVKDLRAGALGAFTRVGKDNAEVLEVLLAALSPEEGLQVTNSAAAAIGARGSAAKAAVKPLLRLLDHKWDGQEPWKVATYRHGFLEALGEIGPDAKEAVPFLKELASRSLLDDGERVARCLETIDLAASREVRAVLDVSRSGSSAGSRSESEPIGKRQGDLPQRVR